MLRLLRLGYVGFGVTIGKIEKLLMVLRVTERYPWTGVLWEEH